MEQFPEIKRHLNLKLNFVGRNSEEGNVESDELANSALDPEVDQTANKGKEDISPEECCPKCKNQVKTSGVWCVKGNNWWHFKCDKTSSKEVEQRLGESDYICKLHEERENLNELKENSQRWHNNSIKE